MSLLSTAPRETAESEALSFAEVFKFHAPSVWRLLVRLGASRADADDLCQEVFVVVHRRWADLDPSRPVRPWIFGVAVRVASDYRRRRRITHSLDDDFEIGAPAVQHDVIEQRRARDLLDQALARLDEPKRAVFVLHELEELKMPEIADALSCPLQTAYSRLRAARAEVKAFFARIEAKESAV